MNGLEGVSPPGRLLRVARPPDPWAWPPWESQGQDGTFGTRWDDANGVYRVLYASSQLEACFLEVLARFRPDPHVVAGLAAIAGPDDTFPAGIVPRSWLGARVIGEATASGRFSDVDHAESLAYLHVRLAARLVHFRIPELDGSAIRLTAPRRFTQEVSSHISALADEAGQPLFAGIAYRSRFGDNYQNWALFERPQPPDMLHDQRIRGIDAEAPEIRTALALLGLELQPWPSAVSPT